jgi:hypothetical protein
VSSRITVRAADTSTEEAVRADAKAIFALSIENYRESSLGEDLAPFDPIRCLQSIVNTIRTGHVWLAFDGEDLIGGLGVVEFDIWYSAATMLSERFFYIRPAYRDGKALRLILRKARATANARGLPLQLTIANAHKNRPPRNGLERIGSVLTYRPRGTAYLIAPEKGLP